jgi:RNA polymerase sigma factor (sigma-70 family)
MVGASPVFEQTRWSLILLAARSGAMGSTQALDELCRTYWYPLYAFVRREGHDQEKSQDLTQEFFARLLARGDLGRVSPEKGRFRSFLLVAMKHLIANEYHRERAQKRGGGQVVFSLDAAAAEDRYRMEPVDGVTPELLYDRKWADALLDRVLERLEGEFLHDRLTFSRVKHFIIQSRGETSFAASAEAAGVTEATLKGVVHRLRQRYRELVRQEIGRTLENPSEVEDELRYLLAVLSGPLPR